MEHTQVRQPEIPLKQYAAGMFSSGCPHCRTGIIMPDKDYGNHCIKCGAHPGALPVVPIVLPSGMLAGSKTKILVCPVCQKRFEAANNVHDGAMCKVCADKHRAGKSRGKILYLPARRRTGYECERCGEHIKQREWYYATKDFKHRWCEGCEEKAE